MAKQTMFLKLINQVTIELYSEAGMNLSKFQANTVFIDCAWNESLNYARPLNGQAIEAEISYDGSNWQPQLWKQFLHYEYILTP